MNTNYQNLAFTIDLTSKLIVVLPNVIFFFCQVTVFFKYKGFLTKAYEHLTL